METWRNQLESATDLKSLISDIKAEKDGTQDDDDTSEYGDEEEKEPEKNEEKKPSASSMITRNKETRERSITAPIP